MMKKNNIKCVAFIFARGGSKGVPKKNIRDLGGVPLIAHSINSAKKSSFIDQVIVSTDSVEIADIASSYGAEVPFIRPAELAGDRSSEFDAWKHAITAYRENFANDFDVFVSLPPTSPLRSIADIDSCIHEYISTEADMVVTVKNASRSPYFNMVKQDKDGFVSLACLMSDGTRFIRRQDAPKVYDMTTVAYVSSPDFILESDSIFSGKMRSVIIPDERAVDIDTMLDFNFAEFLINQEEKV
jgi:N-acylneuraminate cytidylyltransferase